MNEIMFYGGIAGAAFTALAGIVFFAVFYIKGIKLKYIFDKEYGETVYTGRIKL